MTIQEIHDYFDKIGCLTFTTIAGNYPYSRIAHFNGWDEEGVYFRTMIAKSFYRQLKENRTVSVCGMYPDTKVTYAADGHALFKPGYSIRMTGDVRELDKETVLKKAESNTNFSAVAFDISKYPGTTIFCIYRGKGDIFDFDFEHENRQQKIIRTPFNFGGMDPISGGLRITEKCTSCGKCYEVCTFDAIRKGTPYSIIPEKCDLCGSCFLACPEKAIERLRL